MSAGVDISGLLGLLCILGGDARGQTRSDEPIVPRPFEGRLVVIQSELSVASLGRMVASDKREEYHVLEVLLRCRWKLDLGGRVEGLPYPIRLPSPESRDAIEPDSAPQFFMLVPQIGSRYADRVVPSTRSSIDARLGFTQPPVPVTASHGRSEATPDAAQQASNESETTTYVTALFKEPVTLMGQHVGITEFFIAGDRGIPSGSLLAEHGQKGRVVATAGPIDASLMQSLRQRRIVLESTNRVPGIGGKDRYRLTLANAEWLPTSVTSVSFGDVRSLDLSAEDQRVENGRLVLEADFPVRVDTARPVTLFWKDLDAELKVGEVP